MHQITLITETKHAPKTFASQFKGLIEFKFMTLEAALEVAPDELTIVDIRLGDPDRLNKIKKWLLKRPDNAKVFFAVDSFSHAQRIQINAVGGTDCIARPILPSTLLPKLQEHDAKGQRASAFALCHVSDGVMAVADAMQSMFTSACLGKQIDSAAIQTAGDMVADEIESQGLADWVATVRMHHSQTYQHCLLVMGFAVGFGNNLGLARRDVQRLSFAAMVHDIGKARISLAILDKPGALNTDEISLMKKHPEFGFDMLHANAILPAEMLDMVIHHHEYLDGSGYPHGLHGSEISDLVRITTISDVFAALVERRAYKPPLSGTEAYRILLDMGPKLDRDLVKAFEFASYFSDMSDPATPTTMVEQTARPRERRKHTRCTLRHPT